MSLGVCNVVYIYIPGLVNVYIANWKITMYSIFTYIWLIFGVNVGKYSIPGAYGMENHHL